MLLRLLLEGLGLGALLVLICALGIRKGAVGMVHLYHEDVQSRTIAQGLITKEQILKNSLRFKRLCIPGYLAYVLVCVYALNGARGFLPGFWQSRVESMFTIFQPCSRMMRATCCASFRLSAPA